MGHTSIILYSAYTATSIFCHGVFWNDSQPSSWVYVNVKMDPCSSHSSLSEPSSLQRPSSSQLCNAEKEKVREVSVYYVCMLARVLYAFTQCWYVHSKILLGTIHGLPCAKIRSLYVADLWTGQLYTHEPDYKNTAWHIVPKLLLGKSIATIRCLG